MKRLKECLELSILQDLSLLKKTRLYTIVLITIVYAPFYYICKIKKNK